MPDSPYITEDGARTPGWGMTVNMAGTPPTAEQAYTSPTPATLSSKGGHSNNSNNPIESPVVIGGIAAAASALVGLILWMSWMLCRSKRSSKRRRTLPDDDEGAGARPKLPADWATVAEQFNRAKSPSQPPPASSSLSSTTTRAQSPKPPPTLAQQFAFPHNSPNKAIAPNSAAAAAAASGSSSQASSSRAKSPQLLPLASGRPSPQIQPSRLAPPSHPIKPASVGKPQALPHLFSRPLSRDEFRILDEHTQAGTLPQPFAKLQPADVTRIQRAVRNSVQQQGHQDPLNAAFRSGHSRAGSNAPSQTGSMSTTSRGAPPSSYARKKFSVISSKSKHQSSGATSVASSFSFASMPYRTHSSLGELKETPVDDDSEVSPGAAAAVSPTVVRIQPGFHVAKTAFTPLLPDEVELRPGERVTVVDVYTDGWCIVLRKDEEEVMMGAVPIYCFTEPPAESPAGFERTRPERKASLGVTVELETGEDAAGDDHNEDDDDDDEDDAGRSSRHDSTFSWSNF